MKQPLFKLLDRADLVRVNEYTVTDLPPPSEYSDGFMLLRSGDSEWMVRDQTVKVSAGEAFVQVLCARDGMRELGPHEATFYFQMVRPINAKDME